MSELDSDRHSLGPRRQGARNGVPPPEPRVTVSLMFALLGIGAASIAVDLIAGGIVARKLAETHEFPDGREIPVLSLNPGTMFANLLFAIIIGFLAVLVARGGNGARVTAAVFTVLFAVGGLGGIVVGLLNAISANHMAGQAQAGVAIGHWYELAVVALGVTQFSFGLTATILLFGKKTAAFCKAPKG